MPCPEFNSDSLHHIVSGKRLYETHALAAGT